jgi:CubicO group peptidase (beta-lactamase class C family)
MAISRAGLDRLHDAMAARVERRELPGLVALVAEDDDVHVDSIGALAFDRAEPMGRDTVFRIASLTKPVVAAAAMKLVDDGTLRLDEPVDRLLPELADRRVIARIDGPLDETVPADRAVTVEDVLSFRMGYGILTEPTFFPPYPVVTTADDLQLTMGPPEPRTPHGPDEWLRRFATLPLMYQPGQRWLYNTGALVLGVLVARAAGESLPDVLRTRVFEPLGMASTGYWLAPEDALRLPNRYFTNPATGVLEDVTAQSPPQMWSRPPVFPSGADGLISTVDDYLRFARLLGHDGVHNGLSLLAPESVQLMRTNRLTPDQIATGGPILGGRGWGLGLSVVVDPASPEYGCYGWEGGSGTVWRTDPGRGRVCIAMTQTSDFLFNGSAEEFIRLALAA